MLSGNRKRLLGNFGNTRMRQSWGAGMGRSPCCDRSKVKRGAWSPEEDATLKNYLQKHGTGGNWIALPQKAGLQRCGKSCRLRWLNYLRPDIKHGAFTQGEENIICNLYNKIGSRWSVIASYLPGRTDNDVKNYWNTKLKKKLMAENCKPPTIRNMKTSTAAAATPAAASSATSSEIGDRSANYQAFTGSMALPTYFPVPFCYDNTMGLLNAKAKSVSYDPVSIAFPSFILEGSSDSQSHQDSDPFKPFSLGMDGNCDIKGVPMDGYTHEILTGFWSPEEEALGADGNADLFSICHVDSMSQ